MVGGAVRDCALGRPVVDLDIATSDAGRLVRAVAEAVDAPDSCVQIESRFGTASIVYAGARLDLAALRTETYARPGALPAVRLGASIEQDLARRDYSVNAIALGLTGPHVGVLRDPFAGLEDLAARRLRVLHERSFIDDATRLWRGARLAARLRLHLGADTAHLIAEAQGWLAPISARRLWSEFEQTASEPLPGRACTTLDAWGVLRGAHHAFQLAPAARRALRGRRGPLAPELLLAVLLAPLPAREAIAVRLGAPRATMRAVEETARLLALEDDAPRQLTAVAGTSVVACTAARWLDPPRQRPLQAALRRWERTRPPLDARELLVLGVPRGPALGAMLERLRRERYLGTLNGAAEARTLVERWLAEGEV